MRYSKRDQVITPAIAAITIFISSPPFDGSERLVFGAEALEERLDQLARERVERERPGEAGGLLAQEQEAEERGGEEERALVRVARGELLGSRGLVERGGERREHLHHGRQHLAHELGLVDEDPRLGEEHVDEPEARLVLVREAHEA